MEACGIRGCPGQYEERAILHLERWNGKPVVIEHVPAKVCTVCGDVLLSLVTVERLEAMRQAPLEPTGTVPLYEYAESSAPAPVVAAARAG